MEVGIKKAKTDLSKLVAVAQTGKPVFLINRGKRVAQIVPVKGPQANSRGFGMFKHLIHVSGDWGSQAQRESDERELLSRMEDSV